MTYSIQKYKCPVGTVLLVGEDDNLRGIIYEKMWPVFEKQFVDCKKSDTPILRETKKQLTEYFDGKRQVFDLPFELAGTAFQKKVWLALQRIRFGETKTYKDQAVYIRSPEAARAVGRADGLNPLSIVLPCHRVVGSTGALTGYAGGLEAKKWLLTHESSVRRQAS